MIRRIFLDHPAEVNESYTEHMRFAFGFAGLMLLAGLAAMVHAVIPCLCRRTAGRIVQRLATRMAHRAPRPEGRGTVPAE